jgi:hypothetical protein
MNMNDLPDTRAVISAICSIIEHPTSKAKWSFDFGHPSAWLRRASAAQVQVS